MYKKLKYYIFSVKEGVCIIFNKVILILALILIFGISASSANEMNSSDVYSAQEDSVDMSTFKTEDVLKNNIDDSVNVKMDISQKTDVSTEKNKHDDLQNNSNNNLLTTTTYQTTEQKSINTNTQVKVYKEKTELMFVSKNIVRGKYLYIYLKNSTGNGISGQKITIIFANKKHTKITDMNGRISLKMNCKATKYYPVKVKYTETTSYLSSSKSFKVKVYKLKTKITLRSKLVLRGKYMTIFLKDINGKALPSKTVTITINKKTFKKYTNKNGEAKLKITYKAGKYPVKIKYKGSTTYLASSKKFTLKSYLDKTKIEISNSNIVKGNYLYAYLKNSANKPLSKQKITITFNKKKYTRITNSQGMISLKMDVKVNKYKTTLKYLGSTSYKATIKTLTIKVSKKINAKIIANNQTTSGHYSVRLVDNNGNPISNQQIIISAYNGSQSIGSGISIAKKTIVLDSDRIYNTEKDTQLLNDIATILRSKGYTVIVNTNINPNAHCSDIMGKYSDVCVFCIFGGVDSGMFVDMSSNWYQNYLKKYNNEVVLGFTRTSRNLATETWLERAHDDNYSPSSFTGLANPGTYLNEHGFDYVYGDTATQLAENFLNYAINGLSIGKDNILPGVLKRYTTYTNEEGYATLYGLKTGYYKIISSCPSTSGYITNPTTSYLTVT